MIKFKYKIDNKSAFTLVELLVVIPIIMAIVGLLITAMVTMTSNSLANRAVNQLTYEIQDTLGYIEQDIANSTGFLATNNISLVSPQGLNDDTTNFHNANVDGSVVLILNSPATANNPLEIDNSNIFTIGQPNQCDSINISQNQQLMTNIVYFVKDGNLWRRVIMPEYYDTIGCEIPWQQPTCSPGYTDSFCKSNDTELATGIGEDGFSIEYRSDPDTLIDIATNASYGDTDRQSALTTANIANISITANIISSGETYTKTDSITASLNSYDYSKSENQPVTITKQPETVSATAGDDVTFSFRVSGNVALIIWQYSTNNGISWTPMDGATTQDLTISNITEDMDCYKYRAVAIDGPGTDYALTDTVSLYVASNEWHEVSFQNGWENYSGGYVSMSYRKTTDGLVVIRGLIKKATAPVGWEVITTLPVGFRPTGTLLFESYSSGGNSARTDINADGTLIYRTGNQGWIPIDMIYAPDTYRFANRSQISTFLNGWVNYGEKYATASYVLDDSGKVTLQGLIKSGEAIALYRLYQLNSNLYPEKRPIIASNSYNSFGSFDINSTGLLFRLGSSNWLSTNHTYVPSSTATDWRSLSLQNGWIEYSSTYNTPRYTKTSDGLVILEGLVKNGTAYSVIANLPAGYRPTTRQIFVSTSNSAIGRVDVNSNGDIIHVNGSNAWFSLDDITFYADQ